MYSLTLVQVDSREQFWFTKFMWHKIYLFCHTYMTSRPQSLLLVIVDLRYLNYFNQLTLTRRLFKIKKYIDFLYNILRYQLLHTYIIHILSITTLICNIIKYFIFVLFVIIFFFLYNLGIQEVIVLQISGWLMTSK